MPLMSLLLILVLIYRDSISNNAHIVPPAPKCHSGKKFDASRDYLQGHDLYPFWFDLRRSNHLL